MGESGEAGQSGADRRRSASDANPAWYRRSSVAPDAAALAASAARVAGQPPIPATTVRFAASTAPSGAWRANGSSRPGPWAHGTTTPSATDRTCAASTPALAPQWCATGSAWSRTWNPGSAAARTAAIADSWKVRAVCVRN
ncbi:hypothetical protein HW130_08835 [Streptomyces sp. PKU-EA00015]|nr:hypothetical protein [Streptomyces sp. PKU-EA00015]